MKTWTPETPPAEVVETVAEHLREIVEKGGLPFRVENDTSGKTVNVYRALGPLFFMLHVFKNEVRVDYWDRCRGMNRVRARVILLALQPVLKSKSIFLLGGLNNGW